MTTLQDEARRRKRNSRLGLIAISPLCFFGLGAVLLRGTATSEILASDPQTSIIGPAAMGLLSWLFSLLTLLGVRPRSWKTLAAAFFLPIFTALLAMAATLLALDRFQERAEFSRGPLRQKQADLAIAEAVFLRGKSGRYEITLRDYSRNFTVDEADYASAFGEAEQVRPRGRCARVTLQKSAHALRIIDLERGALPRGTLVRCPPGIAAPRW
ncbi:hypothetical protein HNP52_003709 [Sphingomonas kyeonggiensis]|uniref:Uncharacterized protein n=1 Tax=Sphingomonas kyeonggiensis TaxID=1268553 RepID=A0A7W7NU54_9SPHN|nr:hypothetical protein [Sphingomonas kyeonggiensis]MBB4840617.1 hypothetical protein [Sphingomonas kyeonggiensis]